VAELFDSGRIVDLILVLMALEALALALLWGRGGRGVPPLQMIVSLASGACLLLALRAVLTGAGPVSIGGFLGLAFVAHLGDLAARWRGPHGPRDGT
jgi:hypothetical protein